MKKKIISILMVMILVINLFPCKLVNASDADEVYISLSFDGEYLLDKNEEAVAYSAVSLDELAGIDLSDYGLSDYVYDADGDGNNEITALHLYIYTHEEICGGDWSEVNVSGSPGSIFFESGLFGYSDCNLRYDYNGAYPEIDGWGLTADRIVLSKGDFLDIASYTSWSFYSDSATGFHYFADSNGDITHNYEVKKGNELQVKLIRTYSDMFSGGTASQEETEYEVLYGESIGNPTGTVVTDENGCANITFPSAGTWYVWCEGGYGLENPSDIVSAPACAEIKVIATEPANPISVYVTIADEGEIVLPKKEVSVNDIDENGSFNVDEVLYAAHEANYSGGANAGYGSEETTYGLSINTLWGNTSGNYGYWLDNASCWSLNDTVVSGASLVAFVYQNTEVWDSYSKFEQSEYSTLEEVPATVKLDKAGYDEAWNTVFSGHVGAEIKVYSDTFEELESNKYIAIDNGDGTYSVTIKDNGKYYLCAYDNETPIVPAVSVIDVANNPALDYVSDVNHQAIYSATREYISTLGTPSVGSVGGEWMVIDITRDDLECPVGYYDNVKEYVNLKINDKEQLHRSKSTDNSRVILALTSAGYDVTDVDGHNLLKGLTDMTYVKKQGINGPIWALIAFDCHGYEIPDNTDTTEQVTREKLISYILEKQLEDGGWALSGTVADPDMTGMAIQSLAPYYNTHDDVKMAIDAAISTLSDKQYDNGGFGSIDGICSESCAQVVVALTALGINPETDSRFIKNGVSVLDAMCSFAIEGGGFAHIPDGEINGMATEQSQYALVSYYRFINNMTSLYDMSDVTIRTNTPASTETPAPTQTPESTQTPAPTQTPESTQTPALIHTSVPTQLPEKADVNNVQKIIKIIGKKKIKRGKTYKYKVKLKGIKGKAKWSVNKKKLAKISKTGKLKALKKGIVKLTVKVKKYKCMINIKIS